MVRPEYGYLSLLKNCAKVRLYGLLKSVPYRHNLMLFYFSIFMHTNDCTDLGIHVVRPPVNTELLVSISLLINYLVMHGLALRNGFSLAARKCSLSFSLNNEPTTQEWVRPLTLIDLMR
jgi:hypothetical protein